MNRGLIVGLALFLIGNACRGQEQRGLWRTLFTSPQEAYYNEQMRAWHIGLGGHILHDQYLSPLNYGGYTISIMGERSYFGYKRLHQKGYASIPTFIPSQLRTIDERWLHHSSVTFDYGTTLNPAGNASIRRLQVHLGRSLGYRVLQSKFGTIFLGGGALANLGGLYHSRNGNNPATGKISLALTANLTYSYQLPLYGFPARLTLTGRATLLGLSFSQEFGENYYELYQYNPKILSHLYLTHPLNKQGLQARLRLDLPIWDYFTLSLSYRLQADSWQLNNISNRQINHTAYIGIVTYVKPFGGRLKQNSQLPL